MALRAYRSRSGSKGHRGRHRIIMSCTGDGCCPIPRGGRAACLRVVCSDKQRHELGDVDDLGVSAVRGD